MKRLIFYFLILLAAVWLGIAIHRDPGYVLITYQHWSLETTLWFASLFLLFLFAFTLLLLKIFRKTSSFPGQIRGFFSQRYLRKVNKATYEGLCQLAEGAWKSAEKTLMQSAELSPMPLINYLSAAAAAQQQSEYENRDSYLRQAYQADPEAEIAIGLTQAQLQLNAKQWELALATLTRLNQLAPQHPFILQMLSRVYLKLKDWQNLQALLPKLKKHKALNQKDLDELEYKVYFALLSNALATTNQQTIENIWQDLPPRLQSSAELTALYVDYLIRSNQLQAAENVLQQVIKKYGSDPDPILLLCMGQFYAREQQWEKAKNALQSCLKIEPLPQAAYELGQVHEQLGDTKAALDCYRSGLLETYPLSTIIK